MKVPSRMDPQPLLDVSVGFTLQSTTDRPSVLMQWNRVLSSLFNQMDIGFSSRIIEDESAEQVPVGVLRFFNDTYSVSISGNTITVQTMTEYPGWTDLSLLLERIITKVSDECKEKYTVGRISLRYLNFFTIFSRLEDLVKIRVESPEDIDTGRHSIRLASNSSHANERMHDVTVTDSVFTDHSSKEGIVIDIGVWKELYLSLADTFTLQSEFNTLHRYEKRLFSSLIREEILNTLTVEWEDIEND